MASRHLARALVLQTLFECDMGDFAADPTTILKRNAREASLEASDAQFAETLVRGIMAKRSEIDEILVRAAPEWPLQNIAPIDRNALRLGLFELLFGDRASVPPKVALNEAIEIAKSFGGEQSGKFVNGVLGSVYRDIGEPQKGDAVRPVREEALAGALIVDSAGESVLLVRDAFGQYTVPKKKPEPGELTAQTAIRAAEEDAAITVLGGEPMGEYRYSAREPEGTVVRTVSLVRFSVPDKKTKSADTRWVRADELSTVPIYSELSGIIEALLCQPT